METLRSVMALTERTSLAPGGGSRLPAGSAAPRNPGRNTRPDGLDFPANDPRKGTNGISCRW